MTLNAASPEGQDYDFMVTKTIDLLTGSVAQKRQEILDYFHKTFALYESLFECLNGDAAFYARANPLRHPLIFYYGHTAVFFVNKLNMAGLITTRVDPVLESTLAVGVDEMSWDDLNDKNYDWPSPAQVKAYRDKTKTLVETFIKECEFSLPVDQKSPIWIIMMGIEHERIHLETSTVLMRELPLDMLKSHPSWSQICVEAGDTPTNELIDVDGGDIELGKPSEDGLYGWDNEYGTFRTHVSSFKASKYLVSNRSFTILLRTKAIKSGNIGTMKVGHGSPIQTQTVLRSGLNPATVLNIGQC